MTRPDDAERQEDLAATAESISADARRVIDIEDEKQDLDIDDPRLDKLSHEAERLAGEIQRKSRIERQIAAIDDGGQAGPERPN
jgi:hypothetical protein